MLEAHAKRGTPPGRVATEIAVGHDNHMRKTLELEEDVAAKLDSAAQTTGLSVDKILNDAVREGLANVLRQSTIQPKPFHQKTHKMGIYPSFDYSKTSALLDE